MRDVISVARVVLITVVMLGVALSVWAETKGPTTFASLSPGGQKIGRALFEAQSKSGTAKPLTLDEIAALKQNRGWGEVFKSMKAQGLLTDKNLGDVVSSYERRHPEMAAKPDKTKPDKPERMDKPDKPERPEKPGR